MKDLRLMKSLVIGLPVMCSRFQGLKKEREVGEWEENMEFSCMWLVEKARWL